MVTLEQRAAELQALRVLLEGKTVGDGPALASQQSAMDFGP